MAQHRNQANSIEEAMEIIRLAIKTGNNILIQGSHGTGKTSCATAVCEEMGLNALFLDGATLDPYADVRGIPSRTNTVQKDGTIVEYIVNLLPQDFAFDAVDVIIIDEFNRAPPEVKNAILTLIQSKRIGNVVLSRLKCVIAAQNPYDNNIDKTNFISDEERMMNGSADTNYAVEPLDPAMRDRFSILINMPLMLNENYLMDTYGTLAEPFIKWWKSLEDIQKTLITPRQLTSILKTYVTNFELADRLLDYQLHTHLNPKDLRKAIEKHMKNNSELPVFKQIRDNPPEKIIDFMNIENSESIIEAILSGKIPSEYYAHINPDYIRVFKNRNANNASYMEKMNNLDKKYFSTPDLELNTDKAIHFAEQGGLTIDLEKVDKLDSNVLSAFVSTLANKQNVIYKDYNNPNIDLLVRQSIMGNPKMRDFLGAYTDDLFNLSNQYISKNGNVDNDRLKDLLKVISKTKFSSNFEAKLIGLVVANGIAQRLCDNINRKNGVEKEKETIDQQFSKINNLFTNTNLIDGKLKRLVEEVFTNDLQDITERNSGSVDLILNAMLHYQSVVDNLNSKLREYLPRIDNVDSELGGVELNKALSY